MTFQGQESLMRAVQGSFYGLSHAGHLVFLTKLKPTVKVGYGSPRRLNFHFNAGVASSWWCALIRTTAELAWTSPGALKLPRLAPCWFACLVLLFEKEDLK